MTVSEIRKGREVRGKSVRSRCDTPTHTTLVLLYGFHVSRRPRISADQPISSFDLASIPGNAFHLRSLIYCPHVAGFVSEYGESTSHIGEVELIIHQSLHRADSHRLDNLDTFGNNLPLLTFTYLSLLLLQKQKVIVFTLFFSCPRTESCSELPKRASLTILQ